ncbi:MAG: pseudouridylate synthase [Desulfuromonas sp.]|nr:MAG: pseudouridylate synthase [Desulfuromonas sp.]
MLTSFDRDTPITVLYRDAHLIAVHKPAGMVVHPTDLARLEKISLMGLVRRMVRHRIWPVHRLDRPTSGVIVFALDRATASELGRQFREYEMEKRYLAVVRGIPTDQEIDHPLKERPLYRSDMIRSEPFDAVTRLRLLESVELPVAVGRYPTSRYALVELTPISGRRHQLRRHMKHIFHPIIGDTTYGDGVHNRFFRDRYASHRLLLAAVELKLTHPQTGEALTMTAPPDASFSSVLKELDLTGF